MKKIFVAAVILALATGAQSRVALDISTPLDVKINGGVTITGGTGSTVTVVNQVAPTTFTFTGQTQDMIVGATQTLPVTHLGTATIRQIAGTLLNMFLQAGTVSISSGNVEAFLTNQNSSTTVGVSGLPANIPVVIINSSVAFTVDQGTPSATAWNFVSTAPQNIGNFPSTYTVGVSNFPSSTTVGVSNFPSTYTVGLANLLPSNTTPICFDGPKVVPVRLDPIMPYCTSMWTRYSSTTVNDMLSSTVDSHNVCGLYASDKAYWVTDISIWINADSDAIIWVATWTISNDQTIGTGTPYRGQFLDWCPTAITSVVHVMGTETTSPYADKHFDPPLYIPQGQYLNIYRNKVATTAQDEDVLCIKAFKSSQ
jgi:hypothetical protein